jgi:hypothetical protein
VSVLSARLHRNVFPEVDAFTAFKDAGVCYFSNRATRPSRLYRIGFSQQPGTAKDMAGIEAGSREVGAVIYPLPIFGPGAFVSDQYFGDQWETVLTFAGASVKINGHTQSTISQIWVEAGLRVRRSYYFSLRAVEGAATFVRR